MTKMQTVNLFFDVIKMQGQQDSWSRPILTQPLSTTSCALAPADYPQQSFLPLKVR